MLNLFAIFGEFCVSSPLSGLRPGHHWGPSPHTQVQSNIFLRISIANSSEGKLKKSKAFEANIKII